MRNRGYTYCTMEARVPLKCLELFPREMCYQPGNLKKRTKDMFIYVRICYE